MQRLIMTLAVLSLLGGGAAFAQITSNGSGAAAPAGGATKSDQRLAPVGHRQPRVTPQLTDAEANAAKLDAEEAALDRKIKSICRGC
jgi:hypothetical protein